MILLAKTGGSRECEKNKRKAVDNKKNKTAKRRKRNDREELRTGDSEKKAEKKPCRPQLDAG